MAIWWGGGPELVHECGIVDDLTHTEKDAEPSWPSNGRSEKKRYCVLMLGGSMLSCVAFVWGQRLYNMPYSSSVVAKIRNENENQWPIITVLV